MDPFRSLLFVPANEDDWVRNAPENYDADGYIFDLEDAVPPGEKAAAREILRDAYGALSEYDTNVTVRVNAPDTGLLERDLQAVVRDRLDGIVLPKAKSAEQIEHVDAVLSALEADRGIDDPIRLLVIPETAAGVHNAHELCTASDRVSALIAATSRGADMHRALNWDWTAAGDEKRYLLSKLNVDGRAAGVREIAAGAWTDVEDLDGLRAEARMAREIGFTGYVVIHPSHVEPVNEIFTPDAETVEYYQGVVEAMERAEADEGKAAVSYEGEMIDTAHVRTAEQVLERARAFGLVEE
jgi:citrate lyase subunit beta/citryl-CoA lyase